MDDLETDGGNHMSFFDQLVAKSDSWIESTDLGSFPTENNLIENIARTESQKRRVEEQAKGARVLVHKHLVHLIQAFLELKQKAGTPKEVQLYTNWKDTAGSETEQWKWFVRRVIAKRPLVFYTGYDITTLRDGSTPSSGDWRLVGTEDEEEGDIHIEGLSVCTHTLNNQDYMTYDEIQISSLVSTSVPTYFINAGGRTNAGNHEEEGVYVGAVGARFEKSEYMEYQHIIVDQKYNIEDNGYGPNADPTLMETQLLRTWAKFYNQKDEGGSDLYCFPTFEQVEEAYKQNPNGRYYEHKPSKYSPLRYINIDVYKARISYSIIPFLEDANERAGREGKKAYCHVVGLGLGVWQVCNEQAKWMLDVYAEALRTHNFCNISDVNFSWFPDDVTECAGVENGERFTGNGNDVKVIFSKRDPAAKLEGEDEGKLLVAMYAWDGNSFPGNEYWRGMLGASGDPAAACCSTIPQLQNPFINPHLLENIFLAGNETLSSHSGGEPGQNLNERGAVPIEVKEDEPTSEAPEEIESKLQTEGEPTGEQ